MGRSASTGPFWQPSGSLWRAVSRPSAKACSTCSTPSRSTSPWWATRDWWCRWRELLTNQSAPPSVVSTIRKLLEAAPGVSVVPRLEVLVIGPRTVLVTAEVGLNDSVTGEQVTRLVAELRDRLRGQAGVAEVYLTPVAP